MIYFITDGIYTKIGKSNNPKKRLQQLQTANPRNLKLKYVFDIKDKYESILHNRLIKYRTDSKNEWFNFDDGLLEIKLVRISEVFKDLRLAEHKADMINNSIYKDTDKYKTNRSRNIISKRKSNNRGKRKKLLDEIKLRLKKQKKSKISYKPYIVKYGFTFNEISFFVKSAGLSKAVYSHNNRF